MTMIFLITILRVMELRKLLLLLFILASMGLKAQTNIGVSLGTSANDRHLETIWIQHQISNKFSAGLQFRYSQINYRFVDAIAITDGSTVFTGLVLGFKIKETENYQLNFNLTSSYRYLSNDDRPELLESTNGIEFDPNIIFSIKCTEKINLHTGAMLRTAHQFGDTPILNEQLPSAIVLAGLSYHIQNHSIALRAYTGPMNGATGDSMKYFNQISLGYQYTFGLEAKPFSFFNF
jgi:hypothetical protein